MSAFGGVFPKVLPNAPDATIDVKAMAAMMPAEDPSGHIVPIKGISIETSHAHTGGRVLRPEYISQVKQVTEKHDALLHIDGARSWNAAVASGLDMGAYLGEADLISVCLSKGMGTPVGSMVIGSEKNIYRARVLRKMLGGGMRQTGLLTSCALVALEDW